MNKEQIIKQLRDMAKHPTVTLPRDTEALRLAAKLLEQSTEQEPKTPLKILNLSVRAEHILKRGRVHDVETLRAMDARNILAIPDCGKKTLKEISEALQYYEQVTERKLMKKQREVDQAIAEAEQAQPVAWGVDWGKAGDIPCVSIIKRLPDGGIEVMAVEYAPYSYTFPPQRQPLTGEDLERLHFKYAKYQTESMGISGWVEYARAIEAAHGITGEKE